MLQKFAYSKCVNGYMLSVYNCHLSGRIIETNEVVLRRFGEFLEQYTPLTDITPDQVRQFLVTFTRVSKKTLLNYHIVLSSLWNWTASEQLVGKNIIRDIEAPNRKSVRSTLCRR